MEFEAGLNSGTKIRVGVSFLTLLVTPNAKASAEHTQQAFKKHKFKFKPDLMICVIKRTEAEERKRMNMYRQTPPWALQSC